MAGDQPSEDEPAAAAAGQPGCCVQHDHLLLAPLASCRYALPACAPRTGAPCTAVFVPVSALLTGSLRLCHWLPTTLPLTAYLCHWPPASFSGRLPLAGCVHCWLCQQSHRTLLRTLHYVQCYVHSNKVHTPCEHAPYITIMRTITLKPCVLAL